ncbi:LINE-1 retrotransposable element ORF2 protein [Symbiodinium microadriaticum]|uniref:LINE-1 retrotransposable element ORF2 protein n=1 Tax=Symbiodinium microadriaticum TaxID=2951 RepID=A0A1Q9E3W0_SYMMI|nr:LINE-1 retrotransposable element ORF2 protein [Symbiodinium microadriaticum]
MYRGRRLTLAQLGGAPESAVIAPPRQPCPPSSTSRRIRVLSKNVGGMCTSTHDVFMNWLTSARNPYDVVSSRRHTTDWAEVWQRLNRLLTTLPARNAKCVAGDLNCTLSTDGQHVGPGTYRGAARAAYPDVNDAQQALIAGRMCALNTWSSKRRSATYVDPDKAHSSQIDFIMLDLAHVDQQARRSQLLPNCDFSPWREGGKHKALVASIRIPAFYAKVAKALPTGLCRSSLREALRQATVSTAAELTRVKQLWSRYKDLRLIAYAFEAFRRHAAFQRCQKALRQRGRERRRALVQDILQEAEQAASQGDMHALYRHVRRLAPKAPRERIQIRGPDNTILDPAQEFQQIYEYFTHLYQQGPDTYSTTYVLQQDYNITDTEILSSLKQQKAGKAVPQGKVPPDVWKRYAHSLLPHVSRLFQQHLSAGAIDLPTDWRDGWLHLLPKPNKPTKAPANLRPIALQCPLGKCLARIIKTRILTHILPRLDQVPQYAYLPGRSTANAISRIARHCREARQQLSGLRREVHDRRAGKACIQARGAALLSIDMSKAFDQVSHSYLAAAMRHLEIDEDTIQLTLALHQASYHIKHHQQEGSIALRNGIRQGCVLSPLLWVCVTTYMLHCLSQRTSPEWVRDEVTAFADDFICSFTLHKVDDAQLMSQRIQQLFLVLREAGMQANAEKSHFLVKAVGGPLHRWLAKRSFRQRGALFYDMGTPFEPLKLAYSSSIDYLGVVVSYGAFEQHSMDKRLRAARANQALLAKFLYGRKGLTQTHKLSMYRTCIRSAATYGLSAVGVTPKPPFRMPLSAEEEVNQCFGHHLRAMATQEDAATAKRSPPREEGQAAKWHKPSNKGSRGKGQNWSQSWGQERWQRDWNGEEQTLSQKISGDELREVVGLLARLALKHEDTEAALRSDTSFMLYFNTRGMTITRALYNIAQDWRRLKDEGKLNQSLRVTLIIGMLTAMKEKMQTALHEEVRPSLEKHSWLTKANPPAWAYMTYNQEKEEQEVDAIKPPLPHAQAEATIQRIFELISMEGLMMKFHATRPMAPTYRSEVLPFVLMESNRGAQADELHGLL